MESTRELTPTQQRLLEQLRRDTDPLVFDAMYIDDLVHRGHEALAERSARFGGERQVVSKGFLTNIHGCEARHLAPDTFTWTPANARGFVSHKAIELGAHWSGEPVPEVLVDEALARLADSPGNQGDFVAGLTDADRAELRGFAVERVTRFMEDFPPLPATAHPVYEARTRWSPPGTIELVGKTDLLVGRPDGRISTRLIVDFKTGWRNVHHRDDLRFYALLETMVRKVPPRRLVTYYLDSTEADVEDVTEGVLDAALARLLGGIDRHIELTIGDDAGVMRDPIKRPASACRWCQIAATCTEGQQHLRSLNGEISQGFDD